MKRAAVPGCRGSRTPWALIALAALASACKSRSGPAPEPDASAPAAAAATPAASSKAVPGAGRLRLVESPAQGSVEAVVQSGWDAALAERRRLVVYVGAAWCEPCRRFHAAAERGELDDIFPNVTLLEFDLDRDRDRLASAGYASKLIPLFALPTSTGAASGKQIEGGIKGDGALGFIVPRLEALLSE
jgi:hypothetical protein